MQDYVVLTDCHPEVATVLDEALLLWWIALNSERWDKMLDAKDHDVPIKEPQTKRSRKQQGKLQINDPDLCFKRYSR